MSEQNNGGPAFPTESAAQTGDQTWRYEGMTLRDYFAVHAGYEDVKAQAEVIRTGMMQAGECPILPDGWQCKARYMHADLMLKARVE